MRSLREKDSLYSDEPVCWLCKSPYVHLHHVYPGNGRRQISDREGCWVYLCGPHHNLSNKGVHFDRELDAYFRRDCQKRWEAREGLEGEEAHEAFRRVFGTSYL